VRGCVKLDVALHLCDVMQVVWSMLRGISGERSKHREREPPTLFRPVADLNSVDTKHNAQSQLCRNPFLMQSSSTAHPDPASSDLQLYDEDVDDGSPPTNSMIQVSTDAIKVHKCGVAVDKDGRNEVYLGEDIDTFKDEGDDLEDAPPRRHTASQDEWDEYSREFPALPVSPFQPVVGSPRRKQSEIVMQEPNSAAVGKTVRVPRYKVKASGCDCREESCWTCKGLGLSCDCGEDLCEICQGCGCYSDDGLREDWRHEYLRETDMQDSGLERRAKRRMHRKKTVARRDARLMSTNSTDNTNPKPKTTEISHPGPLDVLALEKEIEAKIYHDFDRKLSTAADQNNNKISTTAEQNNNPGLLATKSASDTTSSPIKCLKPRALRLQTVAKRPLFATVTLKDLQQYERLCDARGTDADEIVRLWGYAFPRAYTHYDQVYRHHMQCQLVLDAFRQQPVRIQRILKDAPTALRTNTKIAILKAIGAM
jgi:hypothetical protein